jgi:hypothetical protein
MNELESDSLYNGKLEQRDELESLYDEASKMYEDSLRDQRQNLALYHNIVKSFKTLRHHVRMLHSQNSPQPQYAH